MFGVTTQLSAQQRVDKGRVACIGHPRYMAMAGIIMMQKYEVVDNPDMTACTNGRDVKFGRQFVESLTDAELRFLILHECYHMIFKHLITWKHLWDKSRTRANHACDFTINGKLVDENRQDGFAKMPAVGLYDDRFRLPDGTWMGPPIIFDMLTDDDATDQPQGGGGQGGGSSLDEHVWEAAEEMTDAEKTDLVREVDEAIRQGVLSASKAGHGHDMVLDEVLQPQIDWTQVALDFAQSVCTGSDYCTWAKPNRRYIGSDIYMPSALSDKITEIVLACDTSGSCLYDAPAFLAEMQSICSTLNISGVRILYWGSSVVGDEFYDEDTMDNFTELTKPVGGGGTKARCVTDYMQEHQINPEGVIVFTDGDVWANEWGTWNVPVLWCIKDNPKAKPPVGKTVHLTADQL